VNNRPRRPSVLPPVREDRWRIRHVVLSRLPTHRGKDFCWRIEMTRTIFISLVLCIFVSGCNTLPVQRPSIQRYAPSSEGRRAPLSGTPNVDISNLRPDENSVLFDGRSYPVSVDIAMAAGLPLDTEYIVEAIFSNRSSGPFSLRAINQGEGAASESAYVTLMWSVPVHGNDERIQVNLYRVLRSSTGKTTFTIRDKSIERLYEVRCDPDGFFIVHFLRRVFGACHD
jgi:hypothetical protein